MVVFTPWAARVKTSLCVVVADSHNELMPSTLLYGEPIGTLTRVEGDRSLFAFDEEFIANQNRPVLGSGFKDMFGELLTGFRPKQTRVMPFFSNLLPEERLREYMAERAEVNLDREFFKLWVPGDDLPGAVTVHPADGEEWPPEAVPTLDEDAVRERREKALRSSPAGVQLKFSALEGADGGVTIPATGVGGSWIVKLLSEKYDDIPGNQFSMMNLTRRIGMNVPAPTLVDIADIRAFIRRLVFNTLIGGADMHTNNWSVYYPDKRIARLAPAHDFVSTIDKHLGTVPLAIVS